MTLIFMVGGARAVIFFCILSVIPGNIVLPPVSTILLYRSLLKSGSHFIIEDGVAGLVDTSIFHTQERWLEESLGALELFIANGDHLTVGKFVHVAFL